MWRQRQKLCQYVYKPKIAGSHQKLGKRPETVSSSQPPEETNPTLISRINLNFKVSGLQNCERKCPVVLSHSVHGDSSWQPQETNSKAPSTHNMILPPTSSLLIPFHPLPHLSLTNITLFSGSFLCSSSSRRCSEPSWVSFWGAQSQAPPTVTILYLKCMGALLWGWKLVPWKQNHCYKPGMWAQGSTGLALGPPDWGLLTLSDTGLFPI